MARKLKVYSTSLGFFELAVAAPSMKAAAEAWGSDPDIFKRGFATQTDDPKIIEATMDSPGVVLRRPVGSLGEFSQHAVLPKAPKGSRKGSAQPVGNQGENSRAKVDDQARQAAALERKQAAERKKMQAESERARKQREQTIAKANAAFEKARSRHNDALHSLSQRREELERDEAREKDRWETEQRQHQDSLKTK